MNINATYPDNVVQVKQFTGNHDYTKTATRSSIDFQIIDGNGPAPLEFDANMQTLVGLFSQEELAGERKDIAAELMEEGEVITLASLRMAKGLSQKDLASLMQTSQSRISRLESGREEPGLKTIDRLSQVLECEVFNVFNACKAVLR